MFGLSSYEYFNLSREFIEMCSFHYNFANCVWGGQEIELLRKVFIL